MKTRLTDEELETALAQRVDYLLLISDETSEEYKKAYEDLKRVVTDNALRIAQGDFAGFELNLSGPVLMKDDIVEINDFEIKPWEKL